MEEQEYRMSDQEFLKELVKVLTRTRINIQDLESLSGKNTGLIELLTSSLAKQLQLILGSDFIVEIKRAAK